MKCLGRIVVHNKVGEVSTGDPFKMPWSPDEQNVLETRREVPTPQAMRCAPRP